jgi:hypothetical protein
VARVAPRRFAFRSTREVERAFGSRFIQKISIIRRFMTRQIHHDPLLQTDTDPNEPRARDGARHIETLDRDPARAQSRRE